MTTETNQITMFDDSPKRTRLAPSQVEKRNKQLHRKIRKLLRESNMTQRQLEQKLPDYKSHLIASELRKLQVMNDIVVCGLTSNGSGAVNSNVYGLSKKLIEQYKRETKAAESRETKAVKAPWYRRLAVFLGFASPAQGAAA